MDFLVETSARHIHLTDAAIEALYGPGAKLEVKKMLSQPGQFACTNEKIRLCGPKGELLVSVLGPARKACQVELSFTDARALGLKYADMQWEEPKTDEPQVGQKCRPLKSRCSPSISTLEQAPGVSGVKLSHIVLSLSVLGTPSFSNAAAYFSPP